MPTDPELRRLRDQVSNLEAQLAFARRGGIGGGSGGGCAIASIAVVLLMVLAGGAAFVLMRAGGGRRDQASQEASAREAAMRQQQECAARIAALEAQVDQLAQAAVVPAAPPAAVDHTSLYDAHVTATSGASHVHVGDACRIEITSRAGRGDCRAFVECGERRLYGSVAYGYLPCQLTPWGDVTHAEDDNPTSDGGDPRVVIDLTTNSVTASDDGPAWSVSMTIASAEP